MLVPFSSRQPPSMKRTQDKLVWLFSVVLLYEAWKSGFPRKFARFVPFRLIKKRSFNLLCVLDLFFRTLAVNSVSDFFKNKQTNKQNKPLLKMCKDALMSGLMVAINNTKNTKPGIYESKRWSGWNFQNGTWIFMIPRLCPLYSSWMNPLKAEVTFRSYRRTQFILTFMDTFLNKKKAQTNRVINS